MPTIAVVAVHGVADQPPSESARQIASLLTDLCPLGTYSTFVEEGIRVPVEPLRVTTAAPVAVGPPAAALPRIFEERNPDVLARHHDEPALPEGSRPMESEAPPPDVAFMADLLREYDPGGNVVFETVRLKGKHNRSGAPVHVYEAYWADLSRPAAGVLAFFLELYQLLLHLPSVGRNALDYARAAHDNTPVWVSFSALHRWSIRGLTVFIVVLNLALATLVPAILAPRLAPAGEATAGFTLGRLLHVAFVGLAVLGATAWALWRQRPVSPWRWRAAPFAAFVAGAVWAVVLSDLVDIRGLLTVEVWLLAAATVAAVLDKYDEMRPGALGTGAVALVATFAILAWRLGVTAPGPDHEVTAVMTTVELLNVALALTWRVQVVALVGTVALGVLCALRSDRAHRTATWQTVWTAQTTLALSTVLFANLTLAIWRALFAGARRLVPNVRFTPIDMPEIVRRIVRMPGGPLKLRAYIARTIEASATGAFVWSSLVLTVLLVVMLWSIFPAAVAEARPPAPARDREPSRRLGEWLTRALGLIPATLWILSALYAVLVVLGLRDLVEHGGVAGGAWSRKAIAAAGTVLLASIAARFWLPGASAVLDVILDVDNYLRQRPPHNTPRARIAARHSSLLRFLVSPERSGEHYDAIVIVAHSQGTVITADLLRFLQVEAARAGGPEPWLAALGQKRIAFFTMGSPLRQLYARAFPWLYEWARPAADDARVRPRPEQLGITHWRNAYRSGDYVGRFLWRDHTDEGVWDRRREDPQDAGAPDVVEFDGGRCAEWCIGPGAHTHYWDGHGADIAAELDRLIRAFASA